MLRCRCVANVIDNFMLTQMNKKKNLNKTKPTPTAEKFIIISLKPSSPHHDATEITCFFPFGEKFPENEWL